MLKLILIIIIINFNVYAQTWKSYNSDNSELPDNKISSVTIAPDGTVWFATANGLVYQVIC